MTDVPLPARRLADLPLARGSVPDHTILRTLTTGPVEHTCAIETWAPVLDTGATPRHPSLVLAHEPRFEPVAGEPREQRVRFEHDGTTIRAQVPFPEGTTFYGLGERAEPLERTGRDHLLWNTDAYLYTDEDPALYQSHPYVLALRPDGSATGVVADTPWRGVIAVCLDGVELAFEGEPFDVHLIDGATPREVSSGLAALIGSLALPPMWTLGYHQCRWSYRSAEEAREVARAMRAHDVPCDALWFDIDYMDRRRVFTWDAERFPDPAALMRELREEGFHAVAIVDPAIAVADDCEAHADGLAGEHFVQVDGHAAGGRVWPGLCRFPDFTRQETRDWWAGRVERLARDAGLAGLWNDMNEPAVFRTPTRTLPERAQHRGLGGGPHAKFHNLYGQLMSEATLAGLRAARPDARPFVLTRAGHLATARSAATWTGDNQSLWQDLRRAIPMVLNLGLSGQPFCGPDLGGFVGAPDAELFARWYDLGAYLPFCRGHADESSPRQEPWSFGEEALAQVRAALERRMRLLPTLYTLFEEARRTGAPICRPLFFADTTLRRAEDAFLLGDDLLVAPVLEPGATSRSVALPAGAWFTFPDGAPATAAIAAPPGTTPVFARAGSIVVEGAARRHAGEPDRHRTWHVFLDAEGRATGRLFEDDGDGFGRSRTLALEAARERGGLRLRATATGDWAPPPRTRELRVHGLPGRGVLVRADDDPLETTL
jgi:alpha-glucosidase